MGTMSAPPKPEFNVVLTTVGRAVTPDGAHSKSKIYLLEDRKLVIVYADGSKAARTTYELESASFSGKQATFKLADGGEIHFFKANCNCGMGVVAYSGITEEGRELRTAVRPPDWVSGL